MLAVDTNVVVRYLTGDDPRQSAEARGLIDANDVFVCTTVLLETGWVLGRAYAYETAVIAAALRAFAGLARVTVEDVPLTSKALDWIEHGMDFADAFHICGSLACDAFVSFDRDLVKRANALGAMAARIP